MEKKLSLRARALESRDAIELLSDKWRIVILHVLQSGTLRANALQRAIGKISPKMLTQTLRRMERDGLISRKVYPVAPARVEYRLTDMGSNLIPPLRSLCHWARSHGKERDRARREFDEREKRST